ncbi:DinB family protein [Marinobacter sp. 1Y8]
MQQHYFELLARYNQSMNLQLIGVMDTLPPALRREDQGAFFGSIEATFNHILVADTIWMKRFSGHPSAFMSLRSLDKIPDPVSLSAPLFAHFDDLITARKNMDQRIIELIAESSESDYRFSLNYHNSRGATHHKQFDDLLIHFFNHQTHHRGQITTLLCQAGIDVGVTDLLALIPDAT